MSTRIMRKNIFDICDVNKKITNIKSDHPIDNNSNTRRNNNINKSRPKRSKKVKNKLTKGINVALKDLPSLNCVDLFPNSTKFALNDQDTGGENRTLLEHTNSESNEDPSNTLNKKSKKKNSPSNDSTVEDNLDKFLENFETDLEIGKNTPEDIEEYIKDFVDSRSSGQKEIELKDTNLTKNKLSGKNLSRNDELAQIKDAARKDKISLNTRKMGKLSMEKKMLSFDEKPAIPKITIAIPSLSPALSVSSDYSSTNESLESKSSLKVKRKKSRRCLSCAVQFHHTRDLYNHLKLHVKLPYVKLVKLNENNHDLQNFYKRERNNLNVKKEGKRSESENNNGNSLKLKLKLSKTQNFEVIQCGDNNLTENGKEKTMQSQTGQDEIKIKEEPLSPDEKKEEETKAENKDSQPVVLSSSSESSLLKSNRSTRILTANEIKQSPSHCPEEFNNDDESKEDINVEKSQSSSTEQNAVDNTENRYFECPTFDGLNQFIEDSAINETCTDDLLKRLLEGGNQQQVSQEPDWNGLTSEFISIDRLGHTCTVCNSNFTSSNQLYEHKRATGHNFKISGIVSSSSLIERQNLPRSATHMLAHNSFPTQNPYSQSLYSNAAESFGPYSVRRSCYPGQLQMNSGVRASVLPEYSSEGGYLLGGGNVSQQQLFQQQRHRQLLHLQQQQRRPPPLYRMPTGEHPRLRSLSSSAQGRHYNEMNPGIYMPPPSAFPSNKGAITNPYRNSSNQVIRTASNHLYMKSRIYRPIRPKPPNNVEESSQHAGFFSPSFLASRLNIDSGLNEIPPAKRSRMELPSMREGVNFSSSIRARAENFPMIQKVQGAVPSAEFNGRSRCPMNLNEQVTLSLRNKDGNQNPKEVANILATRGITVTQKSKQQQQLQERQSSASLNSSKDSVLKDARITPRDAMQKLQLNNSVSIISRKKSTELSSSLSASDDNLLESGRSDTNSLDMSSAFISCSFPHCEEKFLTFEGLNRHKQRFHSNNKESGIPLEAPVKTSKCNLCPAMFSTQEGLSNHQRKSHPVLKTTADELGIPVIDLRNEETKEKLASLGIINYIPLSTKQANGYFGLPIVSVQGAANPNVCNVLAMGVSSLLSLGPIKPIPMRTSTQDNSGTKQKS